MPKRVKSDETASRTMSIMPTAAFIRPEKRNATFSDEAIFAGLRPEDVLVYVERRKDAEIAHIKRMSTVGRKNDAH